MHFQYLLNYNAYYNSQTPDKKTKIRQNVSKTIGFALPNSIRIKYTSYLTILH